MHRIANLPSEDPNENLAFIEQPEAPVLFLTSATSDITALSNIFETNPNHSLIGKIRAIDISLLSSNAQIDHYLNTTAKNSSIIAIRFLGSRSDWAYGFEQIKIWSLKNNNRKLLIVSGTRDQLVELNGLSTYKYKTTLYIGELLSTGGMNNMNYFLSFLNNSLLNNYENISTYEIERQEDPYKWNWKNDSGVKIGLIFYSSILNSGDNKFALSILKIFRAYGLCPRAVWVSSLKKTKVQESLLNIFSKEKIESVATLTSFASVDFDNPFHDSQIWDKLKVPVFQLLTSSRSRKSWNNSFKGLNSIDFSLQVVMPELDGRITTKISSYKSLGRLHYELSSPIYTLKPDHRNIHWIVRLIKSWVTLRKTSNYNKKISIVLSNYPIKDGRLANGVGLDTPESLFNILSILNAEGYDLGDFYKINNSEVLIKSILNARTNSVETSTKKPLAFLSIDNYLKYWKRFPKKARLEIERDWGDPIQAIDKENSGFAIHGIKLGKIYILIQPSRGYTEDNLQDIHSPVITPPHRYIAQYLWVEYISGTNAVIHLGKHGTLEWLPGKSVGLSNSCFPQLIAPTLPYLYPFIVNDPGEGSQAKRRTHAVIIDHLTPPLARASLDENLSKLEYLLDEYYDSIDLNSERQEILKEKIDILIEDLNLQNIISEGYLHQLKNKNYDKYNNLDSYLCEIKETQIKTGLHIFTQLPSIEKLSELVLSISNCPSINRKGLTQFLTNKLGISIDPWNDIEGDLIDEKDKLILHNHTSKLFRIKGDYISWINSQGLQIAIILVNASLSVNSNTYNKILIKEFYELINVEPIDPYIKSIINNVINPLIYSVKKEKKSLIEALNGKRVSSGPSGAPTRGNIDVLPTGKNFYSVDLRGLPTEAAWDLGKRSALQILELYLLETGNNLKTLAMSVWATSTMRNGGEDISQLLYLLGVQPIWDANTKKMIDIEVIPISVLNRPRVDVTLRISGLFRDAFPHLIDLVNIAQYKIRHLNESENQNPYAFSAKNGGSQSRIFGSSPGGYGTGLQELINLGSWDSEKDLSDCYTNFSKWNYANSEIASIDYYGLIETLSNVEVVLHSQDNREHDLLDSDDYYQFQGGLTAAVKNLSGKKPKVYFADNSKFGRPRVHKLEKEIDKVVRSRLLNYKWINGMKDHGYKGAFEMSASLDYLFAYDATTQSIPKWCYSEITKVWLRNESNIDFFMKNNPWALRDITERLLEAKNRNMWNATQYELNFIKELLLKSEQLIEQANYK